MGQADLLLLQVSELAEEQDLREIFERFGRVTRVFLAKDRETGRAKGFAFISFQERSDAARACEKIDGCECYSSILLRCYLDTDGFRWLRTLDLARRIRKTGYLTAVCLDRIASCETRSGMERIKSRRRLMKSVRCIQRRSKLTHWETVLSIALSHCGRYDPSVKMDKPFAVHNLPGASAS